jgi:hypothetical protein
MQNLSKFSLRGIPQVLPKNRCSTSRGARAPSRAAVGAPADRFFALLSKLYRSSLGGKAA